MSLEKFTIGDNRTRPPYQIKTASCVTCNAPISLYSEKSQLITCEYCGERLDCTEEELKALGKSTNKNGEHFRFKLHQECVWQKTTYKVIARIRLIDKWDATITDYLLFHPFQGTMWISIYDGEDELEFSVSQPNHALSREDPFSLSEGKILKTEDGKQWRWEESNQLRVTYVDGALPWLAKIGDSHTELELTNTVSSNFTLCVERSNLDGASELEYSVFKTVSSDAIYKAFGGEDSVPQNKIYIPKNPMPQKLRLGMQGLSVLSLIYFVIACFVTDKELIGSFNFSPEEVEAEMLSPTFQISQEDTHQALEIEYVAEVNNSWLSLNIGIVSTPEKVETKQSYGEVLSIEKEFSPEERTQLRHLTDVEISYYHGYEGGESWSEGSRTEAALLMFPEGGHYRIMLSGVSGYGEVPVATNNTSLTVNVYKNANTIRYYILMAVFSALTFLAFKEEK